MNIFLDSSAIIELFKNNDRISDTISEADDVYTSAICAYEVLLGEAYMIEKGRQSMLEKVQKFFETTNPLPFTYGNSLKASIMFSKLSAKGKKVDDFDVLIAAQALEKEATIITTDAKHFKVLRDEIGISVKIL